MEEVREARIHIVQRSNRRLISVLELLSPSNKTEPGRGDYLAKRMAVIRQGVHLVELDLLVGGQRLPTLEPLPSGDYYAFVVRADRRPDIDVFAWTVRQKLPPIPVPLKAPDPDVMIDFSGVFAVAYERGRYRRSIDYHEPLHVPLSSEKLKWVLEQAKATSP
jgi:hypothetical protein